MTYSQFLVAFAVAPLAGLVASAHRRFRRQDWGPILITTAVACTSAFFWDSAAVRRGYWYFDPARIQGWHVGVLPVEECSFFALETWLVAAVTLILLRRSAR